MAKIYAISDLHIDYAKNYDFVKTFEKRPNDYLIVAGDVTDNLSKFTEIMKHFTTLYKRVFFIPGNHDVWIRSKEEKDSFAGGQLNSVDKLNRILRICKHLDIATTMEKIILSSPSSSSTSNTDSSDSYDSAAYILPLHSWYSTPETDFQNSLYIKPDSRDDSKDGEMWMDNFLTFWPDINACKSVSEFMFKMNYKNYEHVDLKKLNTMHPVISFSHFLPRRDLISPNDEEKDNYRRIYKPLLENSTSQNTSSTNAKKTASPPILFNFTKYAGCKRIENFIRLIKSNVHVYGHQHRNRDRGIDGIRYVSHCLGNPREQTDFSVWGIEIWKGPKQVWP